MVAPDRSAAICPRIEEGSARYIEGSGYLHIIRITDEWMKEEFIPRVHNELPEHNEVMAIRARDWMTQCDHEKIDELAVKLGVSPHALNLLNVGWFSQGDAWTFPMLRAGKRLLGVRTRPKGGKKFAIKGSKNGLFIPNNLPASGVVFVCEGESDTAALLTCNLPAVGRPSCNSGGRLLAELLTEHEVVVCMDRDGVGRKGANQLHNYLKPYVSDVTMLEPPDKYKDMREWLHGEGQEKIYAAAEQLSQRTWRRNIYPCCNASSDDR